MGVSGWLRGGSDEADLVAALGVQVVEVWEGGIGEMEGFV